MSRVTTFVAALLLALAAVLTSSEATAQSALPASQRFAEPASSGFSTSMPDTHVRFRRAGIAPMAPASRSSLDLGSQPRWVKWGLVGAVAGAVTFAALGQSSLDPNPVVQDAAVGAAIGFVILGGAIAFYDWVCKPGSSSERAGLC